MRGNNKKRTLLEGRLQCSKCKLYKELAAFHYCKGATFGRAYYCKECASKNGAQHHRRRMADGGEYQKKMQARHIRKEYGLTRDTYEDRWKTQKYCLICSEQLCGGSQTHLDHDHKTGNLRAFLCTNCNRGLGHFKDSPVILSNAIFYLKVFRCYP